MEDQRLFFTSESILVNEKLSYILNWKTENATNVNLTYIGKVKLNGSITVTQEEFNKGPVTLTASSTRSKYIDKVTMNSKKEIFDESLPVPKNTTSETPAFYDSIPRTYGLPYRRYPGQLPRRYP